MMLNAHSPSMQCRRWHQGSQEFKCILNHIGSQRPVEIIRNSLPKTWKGKERRKVRPDRKEVVNIKTDMLGKRAESVPLGGAPPLWLGGQVKAMVLPHAVLIHFQLGT